MNQVPSVIIIGAGAAGIAAAVKLFENGITNITVLEAEDRIGGRINSVPFGGSIVDLGGQWVHGEKGNIVYEMVKDLDLLSSSFNTYQDMTFFLSDGTTLDKNITDELFKIGMDVMDDEITAAKYPGTFGDYFIKVYNEKIVMKYKDNADIIKLAKYLQDWFHKFFTCLDSAESWFDISTKGAMFVFEPCEGNQQLNWRNKGYRTILDVLLKKIPDPSKRLPLDDKIFLSKEVSNIEWDTTKPTVKCSDGTSYTADHIIVTTSVGVLKKFHKTLFTPELPLYKVNSIEHISLGTVNKILLKFPTKWWPDDTKGFSLLYTEDDAKILKNQIPESIPSIADGKSVMEDVFGFYVIDSHPNVLLGWVVGKLAAKFEESTDAAVIEACMTVLKKFLGHKYDIPQPDEILRSKWHSNPHFIGSYVYASLDQEKFKASAEDLARPIISKQTGKATLLFAGDATSSNHYSTVNGAIETGFREAKRLVDLLNKID